MEPSKPPSSHDTPVNETRENNVEMLQNSLFEGNIAEKSTPFNPIDHLQSIAGMGFIALALLIFMFQNGHSDILGGGFLTIHVMVIAYFFISVLSRKAKTAWRPTRLNYTLLWLVLLQLGAFTFNMEFQVFPPSVNWLQVALCISALTFITLTFRDYLGENILLGVFFLLGMSCVIDVYFAFSTLPLMGIGLLGIWFFGLTIYAFSPLLKIIYTTVYMIKNRDENRRFTHYFFGGMGFAVISSAIYLVLWSNMVKTANKAWDDDSSALPAWIRVGQVLPPSVLTEKLLKSNMRGRSNGGFLNIQTNNDRWHDPLVSIANNLFPMPNMSENDRANTLKAVFDARNAAERRLWSGDNLKTSSIETTIDLYAGQRIAYTQQILTIENTERNRSWDSEEAIFTFRLPEGGVVSALSLWVDEVEREGILTTTGKADSAYRTIVGTERRDPSVVHWQEGNSVSVRVFPCTPQQKRRVKIGFTTPLEKTSNKLVYKSILIEGVPIGDAHQTVTVNGSTDLASNTLDFTQNKDVFTHKGSFETPFSFSIPSVPLSNNLFSFDKKMYRVEDIVPQYEAFDPSDIYLDINSSWGENAEEIWQLVKEKNVYVSLNNQITRVNAENRTQFFEELAGKNFSIFPFHLIKNPNASLVISLNDKAFSPDFKTLKGSRFAHDMAEKLPGMPLIRIFTMGSTTYLNTLKQFRITLNDDGDMMKLNKILKDKVFLKNLEIAHLLAIPKANILISEEKTVNNTLPEAPDHLLRLYSYNKILSQIGRNHFKNDDITEGVTPSEKNDNTEAIRMAEKAHIVTPISSLIVLEKQADYDRFDIKNAQNSLGNAALKNAGAAPEPHEWVLIILSLSIIFWTNRKRFF